MSHGGLVERFVRERPIRFEDAMECSVVDHLIEFHNWLDNQGFLHRPPVATVSVLVVGDDIRSEVDFPADKPVVVLTTDEDGARMFAAVTFHDSVRVALLPEEK